MSFYVLFAGESSEDHGMLVYQRPNIRVADENVDEFSIPGRSSDLFRRTGNYKSVKIDITFNFCTEPDDWAEAYRKAVHWLHKSGNLQFSDDLGAFRKVIQVTLGENSRSLAQVGKFKATFICYPGEYYTAGAEFSDIAPLAVSSSGNTYTIDNQWSICEPIYRIAGNGSCDLTVNGATLNAAVNSQLNIDSDLKICYGADGSSANTSLTGDYDDLHLQEGTNTIAVSSGFSLQLQPNWRVL